MNFIFVFVGWFSKKTHQSLNPSELGPPWIHIFNIKDSFIMQTKNGFNNSPGAPLTAADL